MCDRYHVQTTPDRFPEYYDTCLGPAWFDAFGTDLAQRLPAHVARQRAGDRLRNWARDPPIAGEHRSCASVVRQRHQQGNVGLRAQQADSLRGYRMVRGGRRPLAIRRAALLARWSVPSASCSCRTSAQYSGRCVGCSIGWNFPVQCLGSSSRKTPRRQSTQRWSRIFPGDPEVRFRTPYEMHDPGLLQQFLSETGFREARIEKKRIQVDGVSARHDRPWTDFAEPHARAIDRARRFA